MRFKVNTHWLVSKSTNHRNNQTEVLTFQTKSLVCKNILNMDWGSELWVRVLKI